MPTPKSVRTDTVARLIAAATVAGSNVFDSRMAAVGNDELPCIVVRTLRSRKVRLSLTSLIYRRYDTVTFEGYTLLDPTTAGDQDAAAAAQVDDLETEIQDALLNDVTWMGLFENIGNFDLISKTPRLENDRRGGELRIELEVQYIEEHGATLSDDFDTAHVDIKQIDPATGEPHAVVDTAATHDLSG